MDNDRRLLIEKLAADLGVSRAAWQKWWQRQGVPAKWRKPILDAAKRRGHSLDWSDLDADANQRAA